MPAIRRRDFLRLGAIGLTALAAPAARAAAPHALSCVLIYLDGGPSHIDLWDLKPDAPAEVRCPFASIRTSVSAVLPGQNAGFLGAAHDPFRLTRLGVDPHATVHDAQGRPHALSDGRPIRALN